MENQLFGAQNGKIYFFSNHKEYCVNDYDELFLRFKAICAEYFLKPAEDGEKPNGEIKILKFRKPWGGDNG
jgi:hypothetical protein